MTPDALENKRSSTHNGPRESDYMTSCDKSRVIIAQLQKSPKGSVCKIGLREVPNRGVNREVSGHVFIFLPRYDALFALRKAWIAVAPIRS